MGEEFGGKRFFSVIGVDVEAIDVSQMLHFEVILVCELGDGNEFVFKKSVGAKDGSFGGKADAVGEVDR